MRVITTFLFILALTAGAYAQDDTHWHMDLGATGAGGMVGLRTSTLQAVPNTVCDFSVQPPKCSIDPSNLTIVKTTSFKVSPVVGAGLVWRFIPPKAWNVVNKDGIGFGLGTQVVYIPSNTGSQAAPAVSVNVGNQAKQIAFGYVYAKGDGVTVPGGGRSAVVPLGFDISSLTRPNSERSGGWFVSIVLAGKSLSN